MMNTFRYAFRFLRRQKHFTLINVIGLALSLACCIILTRYLYREATVENHCIDPSTVIVPVEYYETSGTYMPDNLEFLKEDDGIGLLDHVTEQCIFSGNRAVKVKSDGDWISAPVISVEPNVWNFFRLDITGDRSAMERPDACWITRDFAHILFGDTDPMGMTLYIQSSSLQMRAGKITSPEYQYTVAGIIETPSFKTILNPRVIVPYSKKLSWSAMTWIRVPKGYDIEALKQRCTNNLEADKKQYSDYRHNFDSWKEIYYKYRSSNQSQKHGNDLFSTGNRFISRILWATDILILIVGLLNFINLFLVYWQYRIREEGIRKVFGQSRRHLFSELWTENFILAATAVVLAWVLVLSLSGRALEYLGCAVPFTAFDIYLTIGIVVLLPLAAMMYPYYIISRKPVYRIISERSTSKKEVRIRNLILGFQYFITFTLIVCSVWLRSHFMFLTNSDTGIPVDEILIIDSPVIGYTDTAKGESDLRELLSRIRADKAVISALPTNNIPIGVNANGNTNKLWSNEDKQGDFRLTKYEVSASWFELFGIDIVDGSLDVEVADRSNQGVKLPNGAIVSLSGTGKVALNRSAMRLMGYPDVNMRTIGQELGRTDEDLETGEQLDHLNVVYDYSFTVCAEAKQFYIGHKTLGVTPIIFEIENDEGLFDMFGIRARSTKYIVVRSVSGMQTHVMTLVKDVISDVCGIDDIQCRWLRQDVDDLYTEDRKVMDIFTIFSIAAIIISLLGLLGITGFNIRQRMHEVAVRKVHGAKRADLYLLLGGRSLIIMLISYAISIPVTVLLIREYTHSFIENAPLTVWLYIIALLIVFAVTAITLIIQLERACRLNPADVIKSE